MKKKTIIISSIILLLIIGFSIFNKNKTEYALIELTSEELLNTFLDEKVSITFALYNEKDIQAEDYYNDLKKVVAQAKENIYYVNTNFITSEFEQVMDAAFGTDTTSQSYYVIQDGNLIINNTYQGFNTMYKELNGKKYNTEIVETSREKKLEYLEKTKKYYQEGNIATAYSTNLDGNQKFAVNGGWVLMIPQTTDGTVKICFKLKTTGDDVHRITLPAAVYEAGMRYTYDIRFGQTSVNLVLKIADWNELKSTQNIPL